MEPYIGSIEESSNIEDLEQCFEDLECVQCGAELDYRNADGNECLCECHEMV